MKKNIFGGLLAISLLGGVSVAHAGLIGPTPYLSAADSPFGGIVSPQYFHLENFEGGVLGTPGVTASSGSSLSGFYADSVDGDDGAIDGSGSAGHSWYVATPTVSFTFDADALGGLPTYAGLVWTDVGFEPDGIGFDTVIFEAFDALNNSLGTISIDLGDGSVFGETAEDRFFGALNEGGISRISLTSVDSFDWELDHLQYGRTAPVGEATVPVPATLGLLAGGLALLGWMRRRV